MKQPLNETYTQDLLAKTSEIIDITRDIERLMIGRLPYDEWPERCKIAGVSEELKSGPPSFSPIEETLLSETSQCARQLQDALDAGWPKIQGDCRPDESFRAMFKVMEKWLSYQRLQKSQSLCRDNIWDIMKAQRMPPESAYPLAMMARIESIGAVKALIKEILDDDIFDKSAFGPFWTSKFPSFDRKLNEIREKISQIELSLTHVHNILNGDVE